MAGKGNAVRLQHFAMDQVVDRFADENAGCELGAEKLIAVRSWAVAGGNVISLGWIIEPLQGPAARITPRGVGIIRQHLFRCFDREMRISGEVVLREIIVPEP